ncbi:MAG: CBS domain-containing protein [Oscillatoria sp. PMC 1068.18]|nr:CBS domain-containing protein [Oscillatoria sp. PMC 1076.18]MEC4988280.1 CBS domain-containing protein [Oscillatoria sp. PMC 1068.18]
MDLILCHQTADFDTLGAAVGLTKLKSGARIVLTGGTHPGVKEFLALHRDEFALSERRSVNPEQIRSLAIADTQYRSRLGKAAAWLDLPHLSSIEIYDHHLDADSDIQATSTQIEAVGATTTLIVERLQQQEIQLTASEATVMALGIHADTGSLTFAQTTNRDAWALAWLMSQNASLAVIREYLEPGLSTELQQLLTTALENLVQQETQGYSVAWVLLESKHFVPGLSSLVERLLNLTEVDALLVGHRYWRRDAGKECLTVIGRSRINGTNLQTLFTPFGGGGHSQAVSVSLHDVDAQATLKQLVAQLEAQIPQPLTARDLMSSPVRTIRPQTTIGEAQRILLRYGHSGLSVVDESDRLVGIISRRDLDIALHHGFAHAPVKGYMSRNLRTINPDTLLPEIEALMVTYDVGRLPVLAQGQLIGIVTRTDVLRQLHQDRTRSGDRQKEPNPGIASCLLSSLQERLAAPFWQVLDRAAQKAQQRGWHLYLVGGGVRDLLLANPHEPLELPDIDTIVDGFYHATDAGAGVELAQALQKIYPQARLEIHGAFQTAALLWHQDPELGSLAVDIATARTEFYPYPAANPEVEASSIRQDLYRRDFTINALAVRLTSPKAGEMLDFFGGLLDLRDRLIRVLHPNSFIEDPTRIYRAVRFAVRLGFEIETQTEEYIRYAISSGIYERSHSSNNLVPALTTRLKSELKYILQAPYWKPALQMLADLQALRCLHPTIKLEQQLWWQIRVSDRWLQRFDPENSLTHWQMRLEVLIASLAASERGKVARKLQLPLDSIDRLENLATWRSEINQCLPNCQLKSEIVKLLRNYKLPALVLVAVKSSLTIRRLIWQYLTNWSEIKPPLNGNDLKALGYKPGPRYKQILDDLLSARLDEKISESRHDAIDFLTANYPQ